MIPRTKADLVTAALRKAAIASEATLTEIEPQSLQDGLMDLELMIYEWAGEDLDNPIIDTGFIYGVEGDLEGEEPHGVYPYAINGVLLSLAVRALPDYKSEPMVALVNQAAAAKSIIVGRTKMRKVKSRHRARTPIGSGNIRLSAVGFRYFPERRCRKDKDDK